VPRNEPPHRFANRPYTVFGVGYAPISTAQGYREQGLASWYGKKFHGQKTSIGEPYDMFAMTAAHTTLALPSYVRVTNVQTGKSVVVRVTDRGPFHADRVIDLSYTAAYKLGLVNGGSGQVEVEAIIPGEPLATAYAQVTPPPRPAPAEVDEIEALARRMALEERSVQIAPPLAVDREGALARGVYLQLGAFANADNADSLKNHLARELDWLAEPIRIQAGGGIHRLQLGPYASRADAERVAERISATLGARPTIVVR
jgi:rare lipoprotein A